MAMANLLPFWPAVLSQPELMAIFMEVHENPAEALSDGPNQIPLDQIENVLTRLLAIHRAAHPKS